MRPTGGTARTVVGLGRGVLLILVVGVMVGWSPGARTLAQDTPVKDLTGETCLGGTKIVDPDGDGPLPSKTYCVINGRLPAGEAIEIDDVDGAFPSGTAASAADANLTSGPDDPTNSGLGNRHLPVVAGATYIDWNDLPGLTTLSPATIGSVEDFHIVDFIATSGKDATAMDKDCIEASNNAGKADLSQIYVANNEDFLYVGLERLTSNGNTVSYWHLTKEPPIVVDVPGCTAGAGVVGQLEFKLTDGDVQILVNSPSGNSVGDGRAYIRVFDGDNGDPAVSQTGYLTTTQAVPHPGWSGNLQPVANLAILLNAASRRDTLNGGDDSVGYWGSFNDQGTIIGSGNFDTAEFVEFAVALKDLFPDLELCGKQLYLTGLSRASTGQQDILPTEGSSLMDVVGPKLYSFGAITATAQVQPIPCGDSFRYCVDAKGLDGQPLPNASVTWECTATDAIPGDDDTVTFNTTARVSCDADPADMPVGSVPRNADGTPHQVTCTAHLTDTDTNCKVDADASGEVQGSLVAIDTSAIEPQDLTCNVDLTNGVDQGNIPGGFTFNPTITGGSGSYLIDWFFFPSTLGLSCGHVPQCTVQIPDAAYCANVIIGLRVRDAADPDRCLRIERDFGYIQKRTRLRFAETPRCEANVTCLDGPPCQ